MMQIIWGRKILRCPLSRATTSIPASAAALDFWKKCWYDERETAKRAFSASLMQNNIYSIHEKKMYSKTKLSSLVTMPSLFWQEKSFKNDNRSKAHFSCLDFLRFQAKAKFLKKIDEEWVISWLSVVVATIHLDVLCTLCNFQKSSGAFELC